MKKNANETFAILKFLKLSAANITYLILRDNETNRMD